MKIGIRAHDYGKMPINEMARKLKKNGYQCVQLAMPKAFTEVDSLEDIPQSVLEEIRDVFGKNDIEISVLSCYMDIGSPNEEIRKRAVQMIKKCLKYSKIVGAKVVGTETACEILDKKEEKKRRYFYMVESLKEIVEEAARLETRLAVEPVYCHPLCDLGTVMRVMDEIDDEKHLRMIFDASNVLIPEKLMDQDRYWTCWLEGVGRYIEAIHVKDIVFGEDGKSCLTPLGKGVLQYDTIFRWLSENRPDMPLIREEMKREYEQEDLLFLKKI